MKNRQKSPKHIVHRGESAVHGGVLVGIGVVQPVQVLHEELECAILDKRVDQNPSGVVVVVQNVLVGEVLEQLHDIDGDVGVVVVEEVDDGGNNVEAHEVRVELWRASEDL